MEPSHLNPYLIKRPPTVPTSKAERSNPADEPPPQTLPPLEEDATHCFDSYDDMIKDYSMEQEETHHDEDLEEEMMMTEMERQQQNNATETLPDVESIQARQLFTQNHDAKDPYSFERYQSNTDWRCRKQLHSPTTMRAQEWKSSNKPTAKTVLFDASKHGWMGYDYNTSTRTQTKTITCTFPPPRVGDSSVPMTLRDGSRVFVRINTNIHRVDPATTTTTTTHALGISMPELMQRVQSIRRQREHNSNQTPKQQSTSTPAQLDSRLWVDKHAPRSFAHLLSDERTNREVLRALRAWDPYVFRKDPPPRPDFGTTRDVTTTSHKNNDRRPDESSRVILLSGPPGVGKTTLAHVVARHAGYRPIEVNGSDERSSGVLVERVQRAMESSTLDMASDGSKPNCLILDEIDGADAKGAIQALVNIIKAEIPFKGRGNNLGYLRRPIIFICNNKFVPALKPLLPYARQFNVNAPSSSRLVARLRAVLAMEHLSVNSALLSQLILSSSGDIRSCLYTLQFASSRAKELAIERTSASDRRIVDVSDELNQALNGDGLKDERKDIAGTINSVFRKEKERKMPSNFLAAIQDIRSSTTRVLDAVHTYGDNSRILDCLFLNVLQVSFIDPTFERCAAVHDWFSLSDVYRGSGYQGLDASYIPTAAAATHLICRVEQKPELSYNTRELFDAHYNHESNRALLQKFNEGVSLHARGSISANNLACELIPYILWILSAGEGSSALARTVTSFDILNTREQASFEAHVSILRSLGLTYKAEHDVSEKGAVYQVIKLKLDPPIERLCNFLSLNSSAMRREIPPALKEVLARWTAHEKVREKNSLSTLTRVNNPKASKRESPEEANTVATPNAKRPKTEVTAQNFLGLQAKKAKEARSARTAARATGGLQVNKNKLSHTGSEIPLQQVVRLKYVKGFTQAVRTPCRLEDLI